MRAMWSRWWRFLVSVGAAALVAAPAAFAMAPRDGSVVRAAQLPPLPACTIIGTDGPDDILGTPVDDVICARGGDDVVRGGGGDDVIFGGDGRDALRGGLGNDKLYGGEGDDRLFGDGGDDLLQGAQGADDFSGGAGTDTVDYALRVGAVRVSIGAGANDGRPGEGDDVGADVENVDGGENDDVLRGNGPANVLRGNGGGDVLEGRGGDDTLSGGSGPDRLEARDGNRFVDRVRCGGGADVAVADAGDRVAADCEHVRRGPPPRRRNHAPTNIVLSNSRVAENQPAGTTVGTLRAMDRDQNDRHTFTLVRGPSRADNDAFRIDGSTLETNAVFDYETKNSYSIRIRVTDGRGGSFAKSFTISVIDLPEHINHAPTDISLSNTSVDENKPAGTKVDTLTATDPDAGDTHMFALVAGPGDTDNAAFRIVGATLQTSEMFDFETKASYSIRVRATDAPGASVEKPFTITVINTDERPTADAKSATTPEDTPVTITLSATDPDGGDIAGFATSGASHGSLGVVGPITCSGTPKVCSADVVFAPTGNYNGPAGFSYAARDGANHDSDPATVAMTVDPVNDVPVADDGTLSTNEDTPIALDLASLASDVETSDANLTYTIVTPPAHGTATATTYTPDANFNGTDSLTYSVTDRGDPDNCSASPPTCDAPKTSTIQTVSITVNPVNDAPNASDGTRTTNEDTPVALNLASLVDNVETSDANLTYTIVSQPAHGTATATTYTPDANFNGTDSVTYSVTDRGDPDNCSGSPPACNPPKTPPYRRCRSPSTRSTTRRSTRCRQDRSRRCGTPTRRWPASRSATSTPPVTTCSSRWWSRTARSRWTLPTRSASDCSTSAATARPA